MKFLCLPGGFGNAKTFRVQLAPFVEVLEADGVASFFFTQGQYEASPPPGFEKYFGSGPHRRFTPPEEALDFETETIKAVRALPQTDSPEESLRQAIKNTPQRKTRGIAMAVQHLHEILERESDVEGIIGYSEGAMMAASVILDEARRLRELGEQPRIKMAVFFSGWPPFDAETGDVVFADESDESLEISTVHVMGAADPMLAGSMALYNLCDEDKAELFDHGHGHMVPRDQQTLKELSQTVRDMISSLPISS